MKNQAVVIQSITIIISAEYRETQNNGGGKRRKMKPSMQRCMQLYIYRFPAIAQTCKSTLPPDYNSFSTAATMASTVGVTMASLIALGGSAAVTLMCSPLM